jgi:hypothetical protein
MDVERRRAPRYRLVAEAEIVEWRSGAKIAARTSEVSLFGCFLNSQHSFPEGTRIQLTLRKQGASFTSCGVIARVHPMGMGVGFGDVKAEQQLVLRRWFAEMSAGPQRAGESN